MKLISIKLCNFRQFYGKTPEITFATDDLAPCEAQRARNTTIIHGNNGAGKTTLLNAFTWVLYEQFTAAFASPDLLINKRAIDRANLGASVECWVEVNFEREHKRYQLKRKCYACRDKNDKIQYSKSQLFMLIAGDDGRWYHPMQQPTDIINRILPESLHQYFFFDGERIDRIFRDGRKSNIAEDTKELLGVKVLDRAIDHLKKAKRTLEEELKAIGDSEIKKLLKEENSLVKEIENYQKRQQEIVEQVNNIEKVKKAISSRLLELSGAEELQKLKQQLEAKEKLNRHNLLEARNNLKGLISSRSYTVLISEIKAKFQDIFNDLRQKGELPSGIKKQFVQKLLEREFCICGTKLVEGTDPCEQVRSWMNRAGIADIEESAIRMETQVSGLEKQVTEFWQEVDRISSTINQCRTEIADAENQLDDLKNKLRNYPNENIQQLQKQLDEREESIKDLTLERGAIDHKIETIKREIEKISKQINKHKIKQEKQELGKRRLGATQEAIERAIEVRSRLENQFRVSLEHRVREIFSSISFTPYTPRLSANYELTLVESTSGVAVPVAASTGENQILSLSFIGGIIDRVREWSQKNTLMGPDSSTFPIVMDSPFGSLDEIYRRQVARSIPQLANQLIVLVTNTQWRGEVAEEMASYIGKQYVLVYNSPKPDCQEDSISIGGVIYPLVKRSPNEFEYTEIIEVKR